MAATDKEAFVGDTIDVDVTFLKKDGVTALDISTATTKEIILARPGRRLAKAGTFVNDGTDGLLRVSLASSDLDRAVTWTVQGHVILASGQEYHTEIDHLVVKKAT